jgi:hypothetical protein
MTIPRAHHLHAGALALAAAVALTPGSGPAALADECAGDVLDELIETLEERQDGPLGAALAGIRADCSDGNDDACRVVAIVGSVVRREAGEAEFPDMGEDEQR